MAEYKEKKLLQLQPSHAQTAANCLFKKRLYNMMSSLWISLFPHSTVCVRHTICLTHTPSCVRSTQNGVVWYPHATCEMKTCDNHTSFVWKPHHIFYSVRRQWTWSESLLLQKSIALCPLGERWPRRHNSRQLVHVCKLFWGIVHVGKGGDSIY